MENEFYEDDFEQLLKEKADQFSMYPSKRVWHSIYNNLHPSRRWPSVVISLFLISSLMFIGYLNTGENSITSQINNNTFNQAGEEKGSEIHVTKKISKIQVSPYSATNRDAAVKQYNNAFEDVITNETDFYTYTIVKSNRPVPPPAGNANGNVIADAVVAAPNNQDIIQIVDAYIKSNKIFSDIAANNKKNKNQVRSPGKNAAADNSEEMMNDIASTAVISSSKTTSETSHADLDKLAATDVKKSVTTKNAAEKGMLTTEEKAWIENYAMQHKPAAKKWKGRLGYQVYATPAVNYRKLTTKTKYSTTAFADGDINNSISQKPGVGIEAGVGLNYAFAKNLQLKGSIQFNYTNYNIDAAKNNHPIQTNILLNDPASGLSYASSRVSTTSNAYNAVSAATPVTLHNTTYQISVPVGFAYKLSSKNNVDWFAGASVQPSYIFGGNAHIISSDLKNYVSEPSSIRSWNVNLGFETYMNFKVGTYNLQVGPQVRYQVNSTYKRNVALVEKPYAVGLKFGLSKGF